MADPHVYWRHRLHPNPAPASTPEDIVVDEALRARFGKPFTPAELRRLGARVPEGPTSGQCENCTNRGSRDMFCWDQRILCGDCRYEARHGHRPEHGQRPSIGRSPRDADYDEDFPDYDEDLPETKFNLKLKHWYTPIVVPSVHYAELLLAIEAEQCGK